MEYYSPEYRKLCTLSETFYDVAFEILNFPCALIIQMVSLFARKPNVRHVILIAFTSHTQKRFFEENLLLPAYFSDLKIMIIGSEHSGDDN